MKITFSGLGADPEVFFKRAGKPISAEGLLGGTKEKPKPIPNLPQGFYIQEDNVAAEFNIPIASSAANFNAYITKALKYLDAVGKKYKLDVTIASALTFPMDQLLTPQAMTLGCEPDFNAWEGGVVNAPPNAATTLRTAAGHLHISWNNTGLGSWKITREEQLRMVQAVDMFITLPSLLVTEATPRRLMYGKAGACRFKPYGVEARSPDNFWLTSPVYRYYIFNTVLDICKKFSLSGDSFCEELDDVADEIQDIINTHNVDEAIGFMMAHTIMPFPIPKRMTK